jgi:hypothetical protein
MTLTQALEKSGIATLYLKTDQDMTRYYATNIRMYRETFLGNSCIISECVPANEWYLVVPNKNWEAMGYESK